MRLVLDTNVVVSALLFRSEASYLHEMWKRGRFRLAVSPAILDEYARVFEYPKFRLSADETAALLGSEVLPFCDVVDTTTGPPICRDPHDDRFFYCAVAAGADAIVSGDDDVLSIGPEFRGIPVLGVRDAVDRLTKPQPRRAQKRR